MVSSAVKPVRSLLFMPMRLNPFRIPELRDLPETVSRQEVVRSVKKRLRWRILLADWLPVVGGSAWLIIMMSFGAMSELVWLMLACFAAWLAFYIRRQRQVRRIQIRSLMRKEHQIPICVRCGYRAASMHTETCSECGKPVEGSLRAK